MPLHGKTLDIWHLEKYSWCYTKRNQGRVQ